MSPGAAAGACRQPRGDKPPRHARGAVHGRGWPRVLVGFHARPPRSAAALWPGGHRGGAPLPAPRGAAGALAGPAPLLSACSRSALPAPARARGLGPTRRGPGPRVGHQAGRAALAARPVGGRGLGGPAPAALRPLGGRADGQLQRAPGGRCSALSSAAARPCPSGAASVAGRAAWMTRWSGLPPGRQSRRVDHISATAGAMEERTRTALAAPLGV